MIPYSHSKLTGNFIHALKATGSPHYDGIQMDGGQADVLITGNTVINDWGAAGAVMTNNEFGPITNVVVDGNFLKGGSFRSTRTDRRRAARSTSRSRTMWSRRVSTACCTAMGPRP